MKSIVIKRCTVQQLKSSNFKVSFSTLQVEKNKNFTSESESHFYTKRTLYENLLKLGFFFLFSLFLLLIHKLEPKNRQIHLKTPCNQEGKLWLCKTQFVKERWCEAWNTVKEEFSLKEAGFRFDVALLFDNFVYKVTDIPSHDESLAEGIFYLRSIYNQDISNKIITWCKKIKEFVDDPKNKDEVLRIPTLNSYERKILHNYGSRLNINHESEGVSPFRELLIKRKKKLEVSGLVVLEILATSKMASSKLNWLHQNTIPWAEISVNSTLSPAWSPNEPIEVIESSEKWICEECQFQLQNHLQLNNVVAVIDKYFYNGVRHRYFYFLFESEISPAHSNKEYFLIKTGYHTFESSTEKGNLFFFSKL